MGDYSTAWGTQLLKDLGYPVTKANLTYLAAWAQAEGGSAKYNPFNTTQTMPGATNYNSVGVKNYTSSEQGLQATEKTLTNGRYAGILAGLRAGTSAEMTAAALANSPWGTGNLVEKILGSGGPSTPAATTTDNGTASSAGNVDCYWKISIPIVPDLCLDGVLWVTLGALGAVGFLVGSAMLAVGSGVGGKPARIVLDTVGGIPGKVAAA